jgi:broad specificity phosphatase PhoE
MHLYLVRHGVTRWNDAGRYQGATDIPLSDEGERQSIELGGRLAGFIPDRFYVSPLGRARRTAELILPDRTPEVLDDLSEFRCGAWEGLTEGEIVRRDPERFAAFNAYADGFAFPDGERMTDFVDRVDRTFDRLRNEEAASTLVVAHGGVIRHILCRALGLPLHNWRRFRTAPASLTVIEIKGDYVSLVAMSGRAGRLTD